MSAELLRVISKLALKESVSYIHLLSILLWNLIARGDNVKSFNLGHISWSGNVIFMVLKLLIFYSVDAMTVYHVKEKRYQGGDMVGYFRSLYANVNEPEVCVVSSMALHIISDPDVTGSLWNKEFVKDAFAHWLQKKIEELKKSSYVCTPYGAFQIWSAFVQKRRCYFLWRF